MCVIVKHVRTDWNDPPIRVLAAGLGCSVRTIQRYLKVLVAVGAIRITRRRVSHNRNETNVFEVVNFHAGVGDRNSREVLKAEIKKTNTSPPAAAPGDTIIAYERLKVRVKDLERENLFYKRYIRRGEHFARAQEWRTRDEKLRARAMVGFWDGRIVAPL